MADIHCDYLLEEGTFFTPKSFDLIMLALRRKRVKEETIRFYFGRRGDKPVLVGFGEEKNG